MKVASLFSGVGGLDYGFHKLGFEIVFANDFSKDAAATYRHNFAGSEVYFKEGDIAKFVDGIPDHDILLGGFPCQPFSLAGKRMGFEDVIEKDGNILLRGLEYQNCVAVLKRVKPKFFFFENVKGLLSHVDKVTGIKSLSVITADLEACGYKVITHLVKMTEYGIPQRRERVLVIGVRKDVAIDPKALVPKPIKSDKSLLLKDNLPFHGLTTDSTTVLNHNYHIGNAKGTKLGWIQILKEGENIKDLSQDEVDLRLVALGRTPKVKPKSYQGYKRLDGNLPAPTMAFGNTCLPIHPFEDRSISVREAANLQSFPATFEFKGGIAAQYKQVGNAVPPAFSEILANHIKDLLDLQNKH